MSATNASAVDKSAVLTKALLNAGKVLGLSQTQIGKVIGKDRSSINRGIAPESKAGELSLLLIRCYRSLFVLVGGKDKDIRHWMQCENFHTQGVPAEQIKRIQGLTYVVEYLDAMRGKL